MCIKTNFFIFSIKVKLLFTFSIISLIFSIFISFESKPGGGTTDYVMEMIESLKKGEDYICFLEKDTRLPMLYIEDAILGTIKFMSSKKNKLNVKESYNITGFSITPEELELKLKENGCIGNVIYKPDYRNEIAKTWPKNINDKISKEDWDWKANFGLNNTLEEAFK